MTTSQINPGQLHPPGDDGLGRVIQIGHARRDEAIGRLVSQGNHLDRDHARRFIEYAHIHRISLESLWGRVDTSGRITEVVLGVPSPGRTAMLFASRPQSQAQIRSLGGVIDHSCGHLASLGVNLAQVLLDPAYSLDRKAFVAGGFMDLAALNYLERPLRPGRAGASISKPRWASGETTVPYSSALEQTMLEILEQSYEDTLDCPGLRGYRKTHDILEGHRGSGAFDPSLWTILVVNGKPAGTLLLNSSADGHAIELVYLGLVKSLRGKGLGTQLLRHGLSLIAGRKEQTIHLAVDQANAPALALYKREGFRPIMRKFALIRPLNQL